MTNFAISKLKWILYTYRLYFRYRKIIKSKQKDWILGRVACLGQDVFKLTGCQMELYNTQKGRVDYLTCLENAKSIHARTSQIAMFIDRLDIVRLIAQEEIFRWKSIGLPQLIYMDSYSELTDQLFIHRKRRYWFCANYSDLSHTKKFNARFEVKGLIPNEDIEIEYRKFFHLLQERFPGTPVLFIHFPVKLDSREKFQVRYSFIKKAIEQIASEYPNFYSISADENVIEWPEEKVPGLENFPYHFNQGTYQALAEQVKHLGLLN
jgi:hypothetical protein